jgi:hypothetical protein
MTKSDTLAAAEARYLQALNAFVSEANENQHVAALVEALTWTLARIAVGYGTPGTGDILGRLGRHMMDLFERYRPRDEASRVREAAGLH